jgi:hypothetical protein
MNAMIRICSPHKVHSSESTSQMRAINTALRQCAGRLGGTNWADSA